MRLIVQQVRFDDLNAPEKPRVIRYRIIDRDNNDMPVDDKVYEYKSDAEKALRDMQGHTFSTNLMDNNEKRTIVNHLLGSDDVQRNDAVTKLMEYIDYLEKRSQVFDLVADFVKNKHQDGKKGD